METIQQERQKLLGVVLREPTKHWLELSDRGFQDVGGVGWTGITPESFDSLGVVYADLPLGSYWIVYVDLAFEFAIQKVLG